MGSQQAEAVLGAPFHLPRFKCFASSGAGANRDARVKWAKQLTEAEAKEFTVKNVLSGTDGWRP
ncbi:MAG: hypothetical protein EXS35_17905 [Pedosphaera sp.]|nr:hypothetical protein [Pedosphaera sp.]